MCAVEHNGMAYAPLKAAAGSQRATDRGPHRRLNLAPYPETHVNLLLQISTVWICPKSFDFIMIICSYWASAPSTLSFEQLQQSRAMNATSNAQQAA